MAKLDEWRRKRRAMEKLPFTAEERARWTPMFHDTWHAIGGDVEEAFRITPQKLTKSILIETVCDANYVETYGGMTHEEYEFMSICYQRPTFKRWLRSEMNYV